MSFLGPPPWYGHSSRLLALLVCAGVIYSSSGCDGAATDESPPMKCEDTIAGRRLFLGTTECLAQLPMKEMSGYWMVGREYSMFYRDMKSLEAGDESKGFWLDLSPTIDSEFGDYFTERKSGAYKIEFIGSISVAPGFYGSGFVDVAGGVLVHSMTSIQELH